RQKPQQRVACARPDAGLLQLPVRRLDRETRPVRLLDPLIRPRRQSAAVGIDQGLPPALAALAAPLAALDAYRHRRLASLRVGQGVARPTAPLPGGEDA